jgi:thymidylate synthase
MKAVDEQLTRKGFDTLPTLKFGRKIDDIDDFKYEDFIIENYKSDSTIKAPLSVG